MREFFRHLGCELLRLYARRRTHIGFAVFLAVEILIYLLITRESAREGMERYIERVAGGFEQYFSALTLAFIIVSATMFLLGLIFIALVAGDILAKESEDGNLRLLLARPVSRFRLLLTKFIACQVYALSLFVFVGITTLCVGLLERGWGGGMMAMSPAMPHVALFDWYEGLGRYTLAVLAFAIVYLPVTGIAFFFSCLKIKPATATIATVAIFIADSILHMIELPAFDPYREYFMATKMRSWIFLFHQEIPWSRFIESAAWLVGVGVTGFVLGWIVFERRDVKS